MTKQKQPVPVESADAECKRLREENARLRQLLVEHNIPIPPTEPASAPAVKPVLPLEDRKERADRGSHSFGVFFAVERTSTRDDGRVTMAGRDIHRRPRRTGKRSTGAG